MRDDIGTLTDREKETLRLLLKGHDAKSIARRHDLSFHTINERLRDARRKLGVSSSREAARLLDEAERPSPEMMRDEVFGVVAAAADMLPPDATDRGWNVTRRFVWLSGGMFITSLFIAMVAVVTVAGTAPAGNDTAQETTSVTASDAASLETARAWSALLDDGRWDESWRAAATMFKSQLGAAQWKAMVQPVRESLGAMSSRIFQNVTKARSLPGAPAGSYEVIQFRTVFTHKADAVETVTLVREGDTWKVTGYFVK